MPWRIHFEPTLGTPLLPPCHGSAYKEPLGMNPRPFTLDVNGMKGLGYSSIENFLAIASEDLGKILFWQLMLSFMHYLSSLGD